jgi:hypothetical protein
MVRREGRWRRRLSERDCRKRQYSGGSSTTGKRSRHATWARWRSPCTAYGYKVERWNRGVWERMVLGAGIKLLCFALLRDTCAGFLVHLAVIFTCYMPVSSPLSVSSFPSPFALSLAILSSFFAHSYPLPSRSASPSALPRHASTADSRRTLTRIVFAVTHAKAASDPRGLSPSTLDADEQPSNPFDPFDFSIAHYPPTGSSFSAYFSRIRIPHTVLPANLVQSRQADNLSVPGSHITAATNADLHPHSPQSRAIYTLPSTTTHRQAQNRQPKTPARPPSPQTKMRRY